MNYLRRSKLSFVVLALLLVISSLPVYPGGKIEAAEVDPVTEESYVRIKNNYTGQYLFALNDAVSYGDPVETDQASHWIIEEEHGIQKLRNRLTNTYMSIANHENHLSAVQLSEQEDDEASQWTILNAVTNGYINIQSVANDTFYLHIEDGTGYAQASVIPADWGTVQWKLESVIEYVRLKNSYTGDYLYALDDKVAYGTVVEENPSSHWIVEQTADGQRIQNRENGLYISISNWQGHLSPLELQSDEASAADDLDWSFIATETESLWVIQHALNSDQRIHIEDHTGYSQASDIPANWGSAQWIMEIVTTSKRYDPSPDGSSPDDSPQYIRIKNDWLELYMFEDNGELHYGNILADDQRGHWLIEEDGDFYRIKNRQSSNYISLNGVENDRVPVSVESGIDGDVLQLWQIENMKTAGNKLIHALDSNGQYLHLEKKLGFIQYGDIPPEWGSPQWRFVNVTEDGPAYIRLKNEYTGQLLFEEDGKVKYGEPAYEDASSHWTIKDAGNGLYRIQNRKSGHFIHIEGMQADHDPHLLPLLAGDIEDSWTSAQWIVSEAGEHTINLTNAYQTNQLIHVQDATGYAQSSEIPTFWGSAKWIVESAPVQLPIEVPTEPVRFKNGATGEYLYENESGVVLYGSLHEQDGRSHWLIVENIVDSKEYSVVNRVTGNQLSANSIDPFLVTVESKVLGNEELWWIEPAPDGAHVLIRSKAFPTEYVHIKDRAGYVQHSLQSIESSDLYWSLEQAPIEMIDIITELSTEPVATSFISHQGYVQIVQQSRVLEWRDNALRWEESENASDEALWQIWDYNGYKLLQNKTTEQFLKMNEDDTFSLVKLDEHHFNLSLQYYWSIEQRNGLTFLKNIAQQEQAAVSQTDKLTLIQVKTDVIIEAEDAFLTGNARVTKAAKSYSGEGIVEAFSSARDTLTFTVYAEEADTYNAVFTYANGAANTKKLNLLVNGLSIGQMQASAGSSWDEWQEVNYPLQLRRGLNTVTLEGADRINTPLLVDRIVVEQTIPTADRGETTDVAKYEAEDQETNGTILVEDRRYKELASEASGRMAVVLADEDDYVSFKLNQPANVITIRFAIPDSPDGKGIVESFGLYVDGVKQADTTLTSSYAWVYGGYPWSNEPTDGDAHRYYDEASFHIDDAAVGSIITIKKQSSYDEVPYLIVDLLETSLADKPYAMPSEFVSITDYGAIANDGLDDKAAIEKAIEAAKTKGFGVWIPAGQFHIKGGPIEVADITIRGAGKWHTELLGYGFMGNGNKIRMFDFAIDGQRDARVDELEESAFDGAFGYGSTIQHIRIDRTKTGIWSTRTEQSDGSYLHTEGLYVAGVQIRNTYADGINFSTGTQHSMAEHLSIRNTGDDGMAIWASELQSTGNTFRYNTVELPWLSNNIAVYGGRNVQITDNIVSDTVAFGAGISISTRHNPEPFEGTTVVARNTLLRTGGREYNWSADFGGLFFFTSDKPMNGHIAVYDNYITDSTFQGISFLGEYATDGIILDRNVIEHSGTWGMQTAGNISGSALIGNTIVRGSRVGALREGAAAFQLAKKDHAFNFAKQSYSITLGQQEMAPFSLNIGQQEQVSLFLANETSAFNDSLEFSIANEAIATISADGIVEGKSGGKTLLTVEHEGVSRSYSLVVHDQHAPSWPNEAKAVVTSNRNGSLTLTWTPAADQSELLGYRILWDNGYQFVTGDASEATIDGLTNGKVYTFSIEALDIAGNWSEEAISVAVAMPSNNTGVTDNDSEKGEQGSVIEHAEMYTREDGVKVGRTAINSEHLLEALRQLAGTESTTIALNLNLNEQAAELSIPGTVIYSGLAIAPQAMLNIRHGAVSYVVSLEQLSELVPNESDAVLIIAIEELNEAVMQELAEKAGMTLTGAGYRIQLLLHADGMIESIDSHLNQYITRQIMLSHSVVGSTVTAVVFDEKHHTFRFIPSQLRKLADGQMEVTIKSIVEGYFAFIAGEITFTDVQGHWAEQAIHALATRQIVSGKNKQQFDPNGSVTRAEFMKLLITGLGIPDHDGYSFKDVLSGSWYEGVVGAAVEAGILLGYEDHSIRPNETIQREQLVAMLMRAYRFATKEMDADQADLSQFNDHNSISLWALQDMAQAVNLGFIKGNTQHMISPQAMATRAEAAILIERFLQELGFLNE